VRVASGPRDLGFGELVEGAEIGDARALVGPRLVPLPRRDLAQPGHDVRDEGQRPEPQHAVPVGNRPMRVGAVREGVGEEPGDRAGAGHA